MQKRRPQSISELPKFLEFMDDWHAAVRVFLDAFYMATQETRQTMIDDEPIMTGNDHFNAFLGGMAEQLSLDYDLKCPGWSWNRARFLRSPIFPCKLEMMKAYLLASTPMAFKRRFIFTGDDPLSRPLKYFENSLI